jgi:predicted metal-dependent hydrolase
MIKQERFQTTLDGRQVSYTLKRSPRARYARLEISPEDGLVVVIPVRDNIDLARRLLEQKQHWVIEKLAKFVPVSNDGHPVRDGDAVSYLGGKLTVRVVTSGEEAVCMDITRQTLVAFVPPGKERLRFALEKWYRAEAEYKVRQMTAQQSRLMGLSYNRIIMKGQKTLWGSCSRKRNLNFNWRLMMAPEPVIMYVVIHELSHLKYMNHSKKFWLLVEQFCPDWREHRSWLRTHTAELNRELRR